MGAYTYSAQPPFEILAHSKVPILPEGLYGRDVCEKNMLRHVIFPAGIIRIEDYIYISIGYNDKDAYMYMIGFEEVWNSLVLTNISQKKT